MKNTLIALLTTALLFFLLHALGMFEFGSIFDNEYRNWYVDKRAEAVNRTPAWKIAVPQYKHDKPACESEKGAMLAVELINKSGGVLGKPIELIHCEDVETAPQYNNAVQRFCNDFSIAALLGPYHSRDIPTARALTQYQGLPLISPITVASEKLPELEADNFITFFPPLRDWVEVLLEDMEARGYREVLLVSPESDSYGDIFCTALERASRSRLNGCRVVRINYQSPLRGQKIMSMVQNYTHGGGMNAVFFGGNHDDYIEFGHLLEKLGISRPVYISDDAYLSGQMDVTGVDTLLMPEAKVDNLPAEFLEAWKAANGGQQPPYPVCLNAATIYAIAQAIREEGGYHPDSLLRRLRHLSEARTDTIILRETAKKTSN